MTRLPPPALRYNIAHGAGFVDNSNKIHYVGGSYQASFGYTSSRDVWTIKSSYNELSVTKTSNMTYGLTSHSALWVKEEEAAYIIGTRSYKYFPLNGTFLDIPNIPYTTDAKACVYAGNDTIYIFGGNGLVYDDKIRRYDLKTGNLTLLPSKLIYPVQRAGAVWAEDGQYAYIVGGCTNNSTIIPGIQRFSPDDGSVTLLDVQFPHRLCDIGVLWLKYLHEIYVFGGSIQGSGNSGDVMMVDLDNVGVLMT
jgi:hypothetical protein